MVRDFWDTLYCFIFYRYPSSFSKFCYFFSKNVFNSAHNSTAFACSLAFIKTSFIKTTLRILSHD